MEPDPRYLATNANDFRRSLLEASSCAAFARQVHPTQLRDPGDYSIRARDARSARDFAIVAIDHEGTRRMQGVITFPEIHFSIAVPLSTFRHSRETSMHQLLWEGRSNVWLTPDEALASTLMDWGLLSPNLLNRALILQFVRRRRERDTRWGQMFQLTYTDGDGEQA